MPIPLKLGHGFNDNMYVETRKNVLSNTEWVNQSKLFSFADDTSSSCHGGRCKLIDLQKDANGILEFMASNGLVANPNESVFLEMNQKRKMCCLF